jgi:hypothetical protein
MTLTSEQVRAVQEGAMVPIVPPEVGKECVLILRDVYERSQHTLEDDMPSPLTVSRMIAATADEDEGLESYQQYKR